MISDLCKSGGQFFFIYLVPSGSSVCIYISLKKIANMAFASLICYQSDLILSYSGQNSIFFNTFNHIFKLFWIPLKWFDYFATPWDPIVVVKVSKGAKIRNRYNQVPHLTQDTTGKVTNSQLDIKNESQEVSPFPGGDHKAHINRRAQRHSKHKKEKKHKRSTKKYRLGTVSKIFYWRA